ncbi:biotin carboxylase N-terminal domain-containing protein [Pseudomonas sp. Marseille-Q5117]|uniref:ATP-binding protein n=1 Tax=Pseudomonas sp. Marseille-Q5117 TaxID=2972777 RepID=UPI003967C672
MSAPVITTLLVANRGEIACRVMRTAKALGLTTVAVHSATDRDARHSREADIRVDLGGSKAAESYLQIDKLIAAAKASGAQAIHPGYGFLSENAGFARAIEAAGLIFLGPPASAIDAMGSKSAAKALMEKAGVPLVPGYHGEAQDLDTFREACERIDYPVLLKATAGGGGKGMKVVEDVSQLAEALASAQREAQSSFGDSRMLVEKYLLKPRHVEIQVFADQHGNCLYLNERDCSIQRRHQKVVEEAPAPGLTPELRRAMGEAAVRSAQAFAQSLPKHARADDPASPWSCSSGLRAGLPAQITLHLSCEGQDRALTLRTAAHAKLLGEALTIEHDGVRRTLRAIRQGGALYLEWDGELRRIEAFDPISAVEASHSHQGGLTAPMNGSIVRVLVETGQSVEAGAQLVVLEAMKMEHSIRAPHAGVIKALYCQEGDMVSEGSALVELEEG